MIIFEKFDMTSLLDNLVELFTFLFSQLGNIANFFTSNLLGMILLGLVVFSVVARLAIDFLTSHLRK